MKDFQATAAGLELRDAVTAKELGNRVYEIGAMLTVKGSAESLPDVIAAGKLLTAAGETMRETAGKIAQAADLLKDHRAK